MKKFISALIILLLVFSNTFAANAKSKETLDEASIAKIKIELSNLSIDNKTQEKLISKLQNGQTWDSMNPDKLKEIDTNLLTPSLNNPIKRYVFEDGSVIENRIDLDSSTKIIAPINSITKNITPMALMPVYYYNVKISIKNGLSGGGFYADYCIDYNNNDRILAVRDSYINVILGSYSNKQLTIVRSSEDTYYRKPAEATLTADVSHVANVAGAYTFHFKMYVGNDRMISGMLGEIGSVY